MKMSVTEIYRDIIRRTKAGEKVALMTTLDPKNPGRAGKKLLSVVTGDETIPCRLARQVLSAGTLQVLSDQVGGLLIVEPYFPAARLIVLGGGHIAKPLVEFSAKIGFDVTVVDDRPSFANQERFPDAKKVICEGFNRCFANLALNASAFVVIITRGHRHDLSCLRQVLNYQPAYIGMIGSRKRVRTVKRQLLAEGYSQERLKAVEAPIGLDIGALTPGEIAISILAQVIQYKRRIFQGNWPELDEDVLFSMGKEASEPRAIATIIEGKGPIPRDVGAKMLVWPDGRSLGSIGGGCSEGAVKTAAYEVMRSGSYQLVDVDLTGDGGEEEGMVCGGWMRVAIEPYPSLSV